MVIALWERVKHLRFWCETCRGFHPLAEHRHCRHATTAALAAQARQAITRQEDTDAT